MTVLHYHPYSQHSRRVIALLESADISYEKRLVSLEKGEHMAPEFLQLNPNHQVPVLEIDGLILSESHAMMRYLCQKEDLISWYPESLSERASVDQWLDWAHCQLAHPVMNIVVNTLFMGENADQSAITQGKEQLKSLWPLLNAQLQEDFLLGEEPTLADLAIGSHVTQVGLAKVVPEGEKVRAWYQRLLQLDGFQASLPENLMVTA